MLLSRRRRSPPAPTAGTRLGWDRPVAPGLPANRVAPEDYYYAWQIAMIVAHLHELRRKRLARYVRRGNHKVS